MPIRFPCKFCDAKIKVPVGSEGRKMKCPRCGQRQQVPGGKVGRHINHHEQTESESAVGAGYSNDDKRALLGASVGAETIDQGRAGGTIVAPPPADDTPVDIAASAPGDADDKTSLRDSLRVAADAFEELDDIAGDKTAGNSNGNGRQAGLVTDPQADAEAGDEEPPPPQIVIVTKKPPVRGDGTVDAVTTESTSASEVAADDADDTPDEPAAELSKSATTVEDESETSLFEETGDPAGETDELTQQEEATDEEDEMGMDEEGETEMDEEDETEMDEEDETEMDEEDETEMDEEDETEMDEEDETEMDEEDETEMDEEDETEMDEEDETEMDEEDETEMDEEDETEMDEEDETEMDEEDETEMDEEDETEMDEEEETEMDEEDETEMDEEEETESDAGAEETEEMVVVARQNGSAPLPLRMREAAENSDTDEEATEGAEPIDAEEDAETTWVASAMSKNAEEQAEQSPGEQMPVESAAESRAPADVAPAATTEPVPPAARLVRTRRRKKAPARREDTSQRQDALVETDAEAGYLNLLISSAALRVCAILSVAVIYVLFTTFGPGELTGRQTVVMLLTMLITAVFCWGLAEGLEAMRELLRRERRS